MKRGLAALIAVALLTNGGRSIAQPLFPAETEASDSAWGQRMHAACSRLRDRLTDPPAVVAECLHQNAMKPLCVDYKGWAWVWVDMQDDHTETAPYYPPGTDMFKHQSDVIDHLGEKGDPSDPWYYKLPDYKRQLHRILAAALARPTTMNKEQFSQYVYTRCLHDLAQQPH